MLWAQGRPAAFHLGSANGVGGMLFEAPETIILPAASEYHCSMSQANSFDEVFLPSEIFLVQGLICLMEVEETLDISFILSSQARSHIDPGDNHNFHKAGTDYSCGHKEECENWIH